jgi:hypothetical protein
VTQIFDAQLEIDHVRGVIYIHCKETGRTLLRIQNLPVPIPQVEKYGELMDIRHSGVTSWDSPNLAEDAARAADANSHNLGKPDGI